MSESTVTIQKIFQSSRRMEGKRGLNTFSVCCLAAGVGAESGFVVCRCERLVAVFTSQGILLPPEQGEVCVGGVVRQGILDAFGRVARFVAGRMGFAGQPF